MIQDQAALMTTASSTEIKSCNKELTDNSITFDIFQRLILLSSVACLLSLLLCSNRFTQTHLFGFYLLYSEILFLSQFVGKAEFGAQGEPWHSVPGAEKFQGPDCGSVARRRFEPSTYCSVTRALTIKPPLAFLSLSCPSELWCFFFSS